MTISYIYSGEPMTGTANDDFVIAFKGSTGTDNNTVNANDGDDWVMGDSSDTWIPSASYLNGSIATAFNLETLTSTWTTAENPMFGDSTIPHSTAIVEATIGQSEFFRVQIGAGQQITIDIDFASSTAIGSSRDLVVELQDSLGNIIASADDSLVSDGGVGSFPSVAGSASSTDPYLTFTVPTAGVYYINVRPFGGGPGSTFTENNTFLMNLSVTGHAVAANNPAMGSDTLNGGAGDDALFGQGGADVINGGAGNDFIHAGSGGDIVHGDADNDTIYGGDGTEENIHGDDGNDILHSGGEGHYYGDGGDDLVYAGLTAGVNEILDGGGDVDTIDTTTWNGTYAIDLVTGGTNFGELFTNFENAVTGNGADTITGTNGDNVITTNGGADNVQAGDGNDTVAGGAGGDTLDGGLGNDTLDYSKSSGAVTILLAANSASGGHAAGDIISNFENVIGSVLGDVLTGDDSVNDLSGGVGGDTLDGGGESDTLTGGIGDDSYVVDSTGDVVVENVSEGTDTVTAGVAYTLLANFENLTLSGGGDIAGTGNDVANVITGNGAANTLTGLAGNDTLDGAGGNDALLGGLGDDTFFVDLNDSASEANAAGTDIVMSRATSFTLSNNIENMSFIGAGHFAGTGNSLANVITGGDGNDLLSGGRGGDTLSGGLGDDTYVVDHSGDVVDETGGGGIDTVRTSASHTLAAGVENLVQLGSVTTTGTGNGLANTMTGNNIANRLNGMGGDDTITGGNGVDTLKGGDANDTVTGGGDNDLLLGEAGNDVIDGGTGDDDMRGGTGDDTYVVNSIGDAPSEAGGSGIDTVQSAIAWTLANGFESLVITTSQSVAGTGNAADNVITGGNGANSLSGLGGVDVIIGGGGADTINGGAGADTMTGGTGNDLLIFAAGQANGDMVLDFDGNGALAGDRIRFTGYGTEAAGATFEQLDATNWQVTSANGAVTEVITFANAAAVHAEDYVFV